MDTLCDRVQGSPMQHSSGAEIRDEKVDVVDGQISMHLTSSTRRISRLLQLCNSTRLMIPDLRETKGALCEYMFMKYQAYLERTITLSQ